MPDLPKNWLEQEYTRREFLELAGKVLVAGSVALIAFLRGGIAERLLYAQEPEKKLDFSKYQPPAEEGVIIDSKFYDNNRKTIIWVSDEHPYSKDEKDDVQSAIDAQKQQLRIAEDLLSRGINLPVVVENWLIGMSFEDYVKKAQGWRQSVLVQFDYWHMLKLLQFADPEERRAYANEHFVGRSKLFMPAMLNAMYPDRVQLVGTDTLEDAGLNKLLSFRLDHIRDFINGKMGKECHHNGTGQDLTAGEIDKQYKANEPAGVDCYCDLRAQQAATDVEYFEGRTIKAAKREVKAALGVQGSKCIMIRAGVLHLKTTIEELQKAGVNYFIVAPRAIEKITRERMNVGFKPHKGLKDPAGHCSGRKPDVNWGFDK